MAKVTPILNLWLPLLLITFIAVSAGWGTWDAETGYSYFPMVLWTFGAIGIVWVYFYRKGKE